MKKLKTIVVEDERLPRLSLLAKLEDYRHALDVVDACDSYAAARESILRHRPDLVFMDIQLQGRDAIQLLEELRQTIPLPFILFTTAYSDQKYLMSAIKLSAVDYLVKPIGKAELAHAVAKVLDRAPGNTPEKLGFKEASGSVLYVAASDIAAVRADGNYSTLVTFGSEDLILESLLSLEHRLPPQDFVRADRSNIVNLRLVSRLSPQERTCTLQAADGRVRVLELSRSGVERLISFLGM